MVNHTIRKYSQKLIKNAIVQYLTYQGDLQL